MRKRREHPTLRTARRQYHLWLLGLYTGWNGRVEQLPACLCPPRTAAQMLGEFMSRAPGDPLPIWETTGRRSDYGRGRDEKRSHPLRGWPDEFYASYKKAA